MLGQFALDYLIIVGVAMISLLLALYLLYTYSYSFSVGSNENQLSSLSSAILSNANEVASESDGAQSSFLISFPQLNPYSSFFCFNQFTFSSSSGSFTYSLNSNISGFMPTTAGLDRVLIRKEIIGNQSYIQFGLFRAIAFVNFTASLSSNTINYKFGFYNSSYGLVTSSVPFNIEIFSKNGTSLYNSSGSANGIVTGSITLSSQPYRIFIIPLGQQEIFSTCI